MAGRRIVDAAKLFNASKSVAQQHIKLRSQQVDAFNKTSTLAKALKNQTDRITLTAEAAIALSKRFNEDIPAYASSAAQRATGTQTADIPSKETVKGQRPRADTKSGLEQDHHYDRSGRNTQTETPSEKELNVQQKKAERRPLPDGTIPSAGVTLEDGFRGKDTFSARPVGEAPKQPLAKQDNAEGHAENGNIRPVESRASTIPLPGQPSGVSADEVSAQPATQIPSHTNEIQRPPKFPRTEKLEEGHDKDVFYTRSVQSKPAPSSLPRSQIPENTEDRQQSDGYVQDSQLNQDVYYSTPEPELENVQTERRTLESAVPEEDQIPEGVNTDVFRTAKAAKMFRGNPYAPKEDSDLKGAEKRPSDQIDTATELDQDTSTNTHLRSERGTTTEQEMQDFASQLAKDVETAQPSESEITAQPSTEPPNTPYALRESRVPSSRFGRLWQYAGLGTSLAFGAVGESIRRVAGGATSAGSSLMLSPGNIELLVAKLSRMRGAALKLGQMISIQDMKMLPPEIHQVLQRVQDSADYMPASQRNKVLANNLGPEWRELFDSFDDVPIAAASIGQVHKAVLRSTGQQVAVKVQYPGVSNSIDSDLNNLSVLLTASRLLPKGLYLDKTIANARTELGWECDYIREAECQTRFRDLLADDTDAFTVPKVVPEASGREVLTAELMAGVGVTKLPNLSQDQRDWIGTQILRLCLREIVEFKFMQTDPNWTNFLFNADKHKIELLDFGASRDYPDEFVQPYVNVLIAASQGDKSTIRDLSIQLGYLTGSESQAMLDAHVASVLTLAEPFKADGPEIYDFRDQTITDRVRSFIPVMVKERLSPPPEETYSLHRKLSGAFLLCARLGSRVPCREMFEKAIKTYEKGGKM
ncbi:ubiquinone biosynthesis protein-like protein coq-8 [Massariosphaeria phaeospora]|uniref:Ubiquinone biosynthesis protein-like protein coq-8 n=1 Tax=Massariosphaeria phaeospora TaxID=100035 RepID=A0A7C8M3N3_9PLEO|nr:ubiquinone biosynthesis protein-like protein coq-8 [Massariosphaeria phaeospora]